jgi:hypothetical protein
LEEPHNIGGVRLCCIAAHGGGQINAHHRGGHTDVTAHEIGHIAVRLAMLFGT